MKKSILVVSLLAAAAFCAFSFKQNAIPPEPLKHRLFVLPYFVLDQNKVSLPAKCKWDAQAIQSDSKEGEILLMLLDPWSDHDGFMPVKSSLTPNEALTLSKKLRDAALKAVSKSWPPNRSLKVTEPPDDKFPTIVLF